MMRHADSEERLQNVRDHDRPITEAGRACAMEVRLPHLPHCNLPCVTESIFNYFAHRLLR